MPFRSASHGTYVPCGHCKACRAAKANKRISVISSTHPDGMTCYFVTLTYSNQFVPYVRQSDVAACVRDIAKLRKFGIQKSSAQIPIYRDAFVRYHTRNSTYSVVRKRTFLGVNDVSITLDYDVDAEFAKLADIRSKSGYYTANKIGVIFHDDKTKFINRLRKALYKECGEYSNLKYYYAPEYGPTTQRPHVHLLLWVPSSIPVSKFKAMCSSAWPYAVKNRTEDYVQVAINAASYVSKYVNCSADVSLLLLDISPLRPSRSVQIGFDDVNFTLPSIVRSEREFSFIFHKTIVDKNGVPRQYNYSLPSYVKYKYFPKCKGYSRLSLGALRSLYRTFKDHNAPSLAVGYIGDDTLYQLPCRDVFGQSITITRSEFNTFSNRVNRAYALFNSHFNVSFDTYVQVLFEFYKKLDLYNYVTQHVDSSECYDFFNLDSFPDRVPCDALDCNSLPNEILRTDTLIKQYDENIKQRKLNNLNSI